MKKELKKKWLAALRSGDYEQAIETLRAQDATTTVPVSDVEDWAVEPGSLGLNFDRKTEILEVGEGFCCLGVLCDVAGVGIYSDDDVYEYFIPKKKLENLGVADVTDHSNKLIPAASSELPPYLREELGLDSLLQQELIKMNDSGEWDFDMIADYLEQVL